jgi:hypothetical protein
MNNWNIPIELEIAVKERDTVCVYCRRSFSANEKRGNPSWEHIINDARIITYENIAICCRSCNSSKGSKELMVWLNSKYCKSKNINKESVADIIKQHIIKIAQQGDRPEPVSGHNQ